MFKLRKLGARGFAHHFLLAFVIVGVAVGGTYYLVASNADTVTLTASQNTAIATNCNYANTSKSTAADLKSCEATLSSLIGSIQTSAKVSSLKTAQSDQVVAACKAELNVASPTSAESSKLGDCEFASASMAVSASGTKLPGPTPPKTSTAPTAAHVYEGHIVVASCSTIEVEAHDSGSSPTGKMDVAVDITGGPYGTTASRLGPAAPYNTDLSGTGSTYFHWATPVAIQDYTGSSKLITITLVVRDSGDAVAFSSTQTTATYTASECKSAPAPANSTANGAHEYEGHVEVATCNNIEVEAHDFGSAGASGASATGANANKLDVSVELTKGPYKSGTMTTLGPNLANEQTIGNAGYFDYYHWATPGTLVDYFGSTPTTVTLVVTSGGNTVTYQGAGTLTLAACASPPKLTTAQITAITNACTAEIGLSNVTPTLLNACVAAGEQTAIAKEAAQAVGTVAGNAAAPTTTVAPGVPTPIKLPKKSVATSIKNFFENLIGHGTPCTQKDIAQGDTGSCVRGIQILVNHANGNSTKLAMNANFDATTTAAVKAFQSSNSLSADGVVGPLTWAKLCSASSSSSAKISGYSVAKTNKDVGCNKQAAAGQTVVGGTGTTQTPTPPANPTASECKTIVKEDTPPLPSAISKKDIKNCAKDPSGTIKSANAEATQIIEDNDQGGGSTNQQKAEARAQAFQGCETDADHSGLSVLSVLEAKAGCAKQYGTAAQITAANNAVAQEKQVLLQSCLANVPVQPPSVHTSGVKTCDSKY